LRTEEQAVRVNVAGVSLDADISIPIDATGVVLFVHSSGSRHSPRNQFVAERLRAHALGTVLTDLMTPSEERADQFAGRLRFDIRFLAGRAVGVVDELQRQFKLRLGLFGASTGSAAALVVAAAKPKDVRVVVSRGGRPDLAGNALASVQAPTLLIVGSEDRDLLELNRKAMEEMKTEVRLEIIPGASHLFHEPGALETLADRAAAWFETYLTQRR
jgi:putative phosphoribosyl transferase